MEPLQPQINMLTITTQQMTSASLTVNNKLLAFLLILRLSDSYDTLKTGPEWTALR